MLSIAVDLSAALPILLEACIFPWNIMSLTKMEIIRIIPITAEKEVSSG